MIMFLACINIMLSIFRELWLEEGENGKGG